MNENLENSIKYIILDFGKVLAYPITGHWFITPKFWEVVDREKINIDKLKYSMNKYNYILSSKVETEKQESEMFKEFYINVFKYCEYNISENDICKITDEITYENDKYEIYSDVKECLAKLSQKYKLILLSDNWPCVLRIMKDWGIYDYFEKIYISSIYGQEKKGKIFFDYPINDYKIKPNEAVFVDDNIELLKIGKEKGLICYLMDRDNQSNSEAFRVIHSLKEI